MRRLFEFIARYRAFFIFLLLQVICFQLLISNNEYHSASFFTSSNQLAGRLFGARTSTVEYFGLKNTNVVLAEENARLHKQVLERSTPIYIVGKLDSAKIAETPVRYDFISAKVVNNSVAAFQNHITINKGRKHGIEPNMGVISQDGVVGKVKTASENYATISSLLSTNVFVSASLKKSNTFCTVNWDGVDQKYASLLYVPRHANIGIGDTVTTSGYNAIFPENIMIGKVKEFDLMENESFYQIQIELSSQFQELRFVYVIKNPRIEEKLNLEGGDSDA